MPSITAVIAGNPSATSNGAVIAAGVPNPDAPSIKLPKSQLMMTSCTRRSGVIVANPGANRGNGAGMLQRIEQEYRRKDDEEDFKRDEQPLNGCRGYLGHRHGPGKQSDDNREDIYGRHGESRRDAKAHQQDRGNQDRQNGQERLKGLRHETISCLERELVRRV